MICSNCGSSLLVRAGFVRNRQRFRCKECGSHSTMSVPSRRTVSTSSMSAIAKSLGLSVSTVSRGLRGQGEVSSETQRRILKAASERIEKDTISARPRLISGSGTIGVIVPDLSGNFFSRIITAVNEELTSAGYNLMIMYTNNSYLVELTSVEVMLNNHVEGLLMCITDQTVNFDHLSMLERKRLPMVLYNTVSDTLFSPSVPVDNSSGIHEAIELLFNNGHRRIAFLGGPVQQMQNRQMLDDYVNAMERFGLFIDESLSCRKRRRQVPREP